MKSTLNKSGKSQEVKTNIWASDIFQTVLLIYPVIVGMGILYNIFVPAFLVMVLMALVIFGLPLILKIRKWTLKAKGNVYKCTLYVMDLESKAFKPYKDYRKCYIGEVPVIKKEEILVQKTMNKKYVREIVSGKLIPVVTEVDIYSWALEEWFYRLYNFNYGFFVLEEKKRTQFWGCILAEKLWGLKM